MDRNLRTCRFGMLHAQENLSVGARLGRQEAFARGRRGRLHKAVRGFLGRAIRLSLNAISECNGCVVFTVGDTMGIVRPCFRTRPIFAAGTITMRMTGNTILITGGTSGIGRGLAEAFVRRGNRVIVTGREQGTLDELAAASTGITGMLLDLDDPASLPALKAGVLHRFPELDTVFANAGISRKEDLTTDDWDLAGAEAMIRTNVTGVLRTAEAFVPHLREKSAATLMVTGSKLAYLPNSAFPTYCATKAFLHSWMQSLRHQLRATPVEVLELLPPYVATAITGPAQLIDPRAMPLDAFVAEAMALLDAGDHPRGEILVERARGDRYAERDGRYDAAFAVVNPD